MVRRKHIITGLFGSSALLIFAGSASAQTIYDSRGFEAPTFAPGDLEGQDPAGPWYSDSVTSTGVVTTSVAKNGTQSVRLDRAPGDDSRWLITKPLVGLSDLIVVEADLRTAFSDVSESAYGPIFALEAYDAYNNPTGPSVKLAGMVGMDAATGELLYQEAGTGYLAATGDILDADTWYRLRLELDYSTDTYSIYLNGVRKATEGFVDGGIDDFTDADLAAIAGAGDTESRNATGTGWFDNFSIKVGPQWAVDGGGTWTLSGNWIGGTPNSAGATANFLGSLVTPANAPATITLDGDKTVGSIRFNNTTTNGTNANSYVIAQGSGGTLILNNGPTGGRGSIAVLNGTHTISAPVRVETDTDLDVTNDGNLRLTGPVNVNGGARLVKDGQGPARVSGPINLATGGVLGSRRGVLTIGSVAGTGGIDVESGGRINVAPQGTTVVRVANLSVAQTGTLDLNDNNLILDALPGNAQAELERVEALVRQGRNGGSWNGNGVTSTAARDESRSITGLAVIRNSDNGTTPVLTSFEGQSVDADDILVKYTYNGDANLDGRINSDDYFRIDRGFLAQPANPTYRDGDFNYDDRVNSDDYFLIDSAFLSQGGTLEGGVLQAVAVPEPGLLSLGSLAALGLLGRRGRRTK